jgi:hypothetical protein
VQTHHLAWLIYYRHRWKNKTREGAIRRDFSSRSNASRGREAAASARGSQAALRSCGNTVFSRPEVVRAASATTVVGRYVCKNLESMPWVSEQVEQ